MSGCHPTEEPKLMQDLMKMTTDIVALSFKVEELESHLNKIHEMLNLEDRITSSDVLNRLTLLENSEIQHFKNYKRWIDELEQKVCDIFSIQEKRMSELEKFKHLRYTKFDLKPQKCPICEGSGRTSNVPKIYGDLCVPCEGKGVLWG